MEIHFQSHSSSISIPILLFPLPFPFPWYSHCHSHSHGNPMGPMGSQLFPFPCTSLNSQSQSQCSFISITLITSLYFNSRQSPWKNTHNILRKFKDVKRKNNFKKTLKTYNVSTVADVDVKTIYCRHDANNLSTKALEMLQQQQRMDGWYGIPRTALAGLGGVSSTFEGQWHVSHYRTLSFVTLLIFPAVIAFTCLKNVT